MAKFKIGDIPTSRLLPAGNYDLRITGLEEQISKSGLLMYRLETRVVAPEVCKNRGYTMYLVVGKHPNVCPPKSSEEWARYCELDDPMAEDPQTQRFSSGLRTLKQVLTAIDHPTATGDVIDMDEIMADMAIANPNEQFVFGASITNDKDKNGRETNNTSFIYEQGKQEPGILGDKVNKARPRTPASAKKPMTRAAFEQTDDDDLD